MKNFKSYSLITEDIKSKLRKLKNLSSKEKKKLLTFFQQNSTLQGAEGNIDWNNKNLTYDDFSDVIETGTRNKIKSNVKKQGISGLREGKDYIDVSEYFDYYNAYIALNYESSKALGSKYIGKCEGKWCTSSNRPATWNYYNANNVIIVIIISPDQTEKYALAAHPQLPDVEIYAANGKEVKTTPHENTKSVVRSNIHTFQSYAIQAQKYVYKNVEWFTKRGNHSDVTYVITADNEINMSAGTWNDGTWVAGTFYDSLWRNGIWRDGNFVNSIWRNGKWEHGDFSNSHWKNGIWVTGNFKESIWDDGDWLYGIFWSGEFNGGYFHDGIWVSGNWNAPDENWLGGMDQHRNIHPAGDSPNNW